MTPEDFLRIFTVDFEAGRIFWKNPPANHAKKIGAEAGYLNAGKGKNKTYWQIRAFGRTFKRSRLIFYMAYGFWPTPKVDHINRNTLDDSLGNLRQCTSSQNSANSANKARKHQCPRGVYRTKQGRFMARITQGGKTQNLGTSDTIEEAMATYERARKEIFGEFS